MGLGRIIADITTYDGGLAPKLMEVALFPLSSVMSCSEVSQNAILLETLSFAAVLTMARV
eukprot:3435606-Rhodomonas_salina.1